MTSERSKISPGSPRACPVSPECTARPSASFFQADRVRPGHTLRAVPRQQVALCAVLALISLSQGKHRAFPAAQACIAQRLVLLLQPDCAWPALTPRHTLHLRPALHVGSVPTKIKLARAHVYPVMRVHTAAAQASLLSAAAALRERSPLAAPPRPRARPAPQASTAQLQA